MVVVGGDDNCGEFVSSMERYDPSTNAWEEEAMAPMTSARKYVSMAVLDGKLYAAGGESEADGTPSNLVERYDLTTNAWEAVAPTAAVRDSHAVAVLDAKLYAVGGYDDDDGYLSSAERYDAATNAREAVRREHN